ncbi:uncharacterized protein LOC131678717 [Topomyia yanbarensis]|uniref:uncharacterized protein LOC131678717 n=1 Tax=Topomyia yanbarensis TaxID=2498891 RepID=UPI00273CEBDF|nr:uncharacterized protein LOC131678717 [Topomyia yanbarensis]
MKLWIGLLLVGLALEGRAQLTCFVCNGCPDPFDTSATQLPCPQTEGTTTVAPPNTNDPILTPPTIPGATTTVVPGTTTAPTPGPGDPILTPPPVGRRKRQVSTLPRCYIVTINGIVHRGCTNFVTDQATTCRNLNSGIDPVGECRICDWSGCNSASGLTLSIATILAALFIALKLF